MFTDFLILDSQNLTVQEAEKPKKTHKRYCLLVLVFQHGGRREPVQMLAVLGSPENTVTSTLQASDPCQESSAIIWGGSCHPIQQISAINSTECTQSTRVNVWLQRGPTAESPAIQVKPMFLKDKPTLLILQKSARRIFREIAQELYHKRYVETCQQPVSIKQQRAQCRSKHIKKALPTSCQ